MQELRILDDVMCNIRQHLDPRLSVTLLKLHSGVNLLKVSPPNLHPSLSTLPPSHLLLRYLPPPQDTLCLELLSYRLEPLRPLVNLGCYDRDTETGLPTYILYIRQQLLSTSYSLCSGIPEAKLVPLYPGLSKALLLTSLIEKSLENPGKLVFRSRACLTVYPASQLEEGEGLCGACLQFWSQSQTGDAETDTETDEGAGLSNSLACPYPGCRRVFRWKKSFEKHLTRHSQVERRQGKEQEKQGENQEEEGEGDGGDSSWAVESQVEVKCEPVIGTDREEEEVTQEAAESSRKRKVRGWKVAGVRQKRERRVCSHCSKAYINLESFLKHLRNVHPAVEDSESGRRKEPPGTGTASQDLAGKQKDFNTSHRCSECQQSFPFAELLAEHVAGDSVGGTCDNCSIVCSSKCELVKHQRSEHRELEHMSREKLEGAEQLEGNQLAEEQLEGSQQGGRQIAKEQLEGRQIAKEQLEESQLAEKQQGERQLAKEQLEENQLAKEQLDGNQLAQEQVEESQLAEKQQGERQLAKEQLEGSQLPQEQLEGNQLAPNQKEGRQLGEEQQPCYVCGKWMKKTSIQTHVKMVHAGEENRIHLCNICGKGYKTRTDHDRHYTKHTGQKRYYCPVCGKGYRFWGGADDCKRKHDKNLRHWCTFPGCSKGFNSRFRLLQHSRVHSGSKPFQCPLCPYDCSRRDNLIKHIRGTHKYDPERTEQLETETGGFAKTCPPSASQEDP